MSLDSVTPSTLRVGPAGGFPRVADAEADARRLLSQGYLDLANASKAAALRGQRAPLVNPFALSDPPPGVLPSGVRPTMAQDAQVKATLDWATEQRRERLALDEQVIQFFSSGGFVGGGLAFANGYAFPGYSYLAELAQVPEYRVITETIASEMTREWIELKSSTHRDRRRLPKEKAKKLELIEERLDHLGTKDRFCELAEIDGFEGRAHLYLDTGDTEDREELKTPIGDGKSSLSKRKVSPQRPLIALRSIEATWCYPTRYNSDDPLKADWYKPSAWFVMGKELHVSRLIPFVGREVLDLLKPTYNFGGLSLSQMAKPYVDNWLRTRQAVADLIWSFSTNVLKTDLQTLLQAGSSAADVLSRVEAFNALRTNQGTLVINKDSEDWANVATPLGGLHELQAQAQEHMASVSRIPLVKLLGIQPSGLNASSEGEIRAFYDSILAYQEKLFRNPLTNVLHFVQLSLFGEIDPEITFDFKPLWQLDSVALAGVQQVKSATRETDIAAGVVSPEEGREAIANDPDSQYAGLDLSESEAPGEQLGEGEEEADPYGEDPDAEGEQLGGPKPKGSHLGSAITTRAAEFGSPATGGFGA